MLVVVLSVAGWKTRVRLSNKATEKRRDETSKTCKFRG